MRKKFISFGIAISMIISSVNTFAATLEPDAELTKADEIAIMFDSSYKKNTDAADIFEVGGKEFIMADSFDDENSAFYVVSKSIVGHAAFSKTDSKKFDINDEESLAYLLNEKTSDYLPENIIKYINKNHVWYTEPTSTDAAYQVTAGVTVPAVWELNKYKSVVGYEDGCSKNTSVDDQQYWLRTPGDAAKSIHQVWPDFEMALVMSETGDQMGIRPQFMLKKDFFLKVKADKIGDNVKKIIKNTYSIDEMINSGIYSLSELSVLGYDTSSFPSVSNVIITENGKKLTVKFDKNGKTDGCEFKIKWLVSDTASGTYGAISGETSNVLTLADKYSQKYIKAQITPVSEGGFEYASVVSDHIFYEGIKLSKVTDFKVDTDTSWNKNTPEENIFTFGGQNFVMADAFADSEDATFYVVAAQSYGGDRYFGTETKYDPEEEDSIAYYANNDVIKLLPEELVKYICPDYEWLVEPTKFASQYTVKATIAIPAVWELQKYKDVLGYSDGINWYWLRSPHQDTISGQTNPYMMTYIQAGRWSIVNDCVSAKSLKDSGVTCKTRPQFMLGRDFFLKNNVPISDMGSAVQKKLAAVYDYDEMLSTGFYTETQLKDMGFTYRYNIDAKFTAYDGSALGTTVSADKGIKASYTINNSYQDSVSGIARLALYDADGQVVAVKSENKTVPAESAVTGTISVETLPKEAASAKVFFWTSDDLPIAKYAGLNDSGIFTVTNKSDDLVINHAKAAEELQIRGKISDSNKNYMNRIGIAVLKDSDTVVSDTNVYYIGETDVDENGYFDFKVKMDCTAGYYTAIVTLPRGGKTTYKFYFEKSSVYEGILNGINGVAAGDDNALGTVADSDTNKIILGLPLEMETGIKATDYKTKIYKAIAGMRFNDIDEFMEEYTRQVIAQKISELSAAEAEQIINANIDILKISESEFYDSYLYVKGYEKKAYEALSELTVGKKYADYNEFYNAFIDNIFIAAAKNATVIGMNKLIADNITYFDNKGMNTATYLAMGNTARATAVGKVIGQSYADITKLAEAINTAMKQKTDNGGGGGSSSSSKGSSIISPVIQPQVDTNIGGTEERFGDLGNFDWAKASINALADKGILSGKGDNKFAPQDRITREEFAKIVVEALGYGIEEGNGGFEDVQADKWFAKYVYTAKKNNIIQGIADTAFGVGMNITRQDMAVILHRASGLTALEEVSFDDEGSIAPYALEAVKVLASHKIINGNGSGKFNPQDFATRAECAVMVYNFLQKIN